MSNSSDSTIGTPERYSAHEILGKPLVGVRRLNAPQQSERWNEHLANDLRVDGRRPGIHLLQPAQWVHGAAAAGAHAALTGRLQYHPIHAFNQQRPVGHAEVGAMFANPQGHVIGYEGGFPDELASPRYAGDDITHRIPHYLAPDAAENYFTINEGERAADPELHRAWQAGESWLNNEIGRQVAAGQHHAHVTINESRPFRAFLQAAIESPDDPAPVQMLHDWLEEMGDPRASRLVAVRDERGMPTAWHQGPAAAGSLAEEIADPSSRRLESLRDANRQASANWEGADWPTSHEWRHTRWNQGHSYEDEPGWEPEELSGSLSADGIDPDANVDDYVQQEMDGIDTDGWHPDEVDELRDSIRDAIEGAMEYARDARNDAQAARDAGTAALNAARLGDWQAAIRAARRAVDIENQYGDSPSWRPFLHAVESAAESAESAESGDEDDEDDEDDQ